MVNELEQAWTGVEKSDRAFIFDLVPPTHFELLIVCLPLYTRYRKLKGPVGILHVPPEASIVI